MAELSIHFDKIVSTMARLKSNEADRASDVGEDREEIGNLLDLTGVHKKAFSWIRSLDKLEADKRDDILRSFDALREMLEQHWRGQSSTPDMFDDDAVEPSNDDDFEPQHEHSDPDLAEDADEFDKAMAEAAE